jgi:hypothetical protein
MNRVWRVKKTLALALVGSATLFGCGGGDDSTSNTNTKAGGQAAQPDGGGGGASACLDTWNAASKDVRAQASLSHRGDTPKDVYVGTYKGQAFTDTGSSYDASGSPSSADISVAPGDCVAVDRTGSNDADTNWVMVAPKANGGGKNWYFLDETGSHPLAKSPQPLDGQTTVAITGLGEDAKLNP